MTDLLNIRLLGSFEVARADTLLQGFESNKVRALLAYLAVEVDRSHQRRKLAGLLWPEFPESAALSNLRYALSNLRKVIGDRVAQPAYLEINPQEIRVNQSSNCILDVREFESCCALAHQNPLDFKSLNKAAELYRGRFLEGFAATDSNAFEEWLVLKREHLDRLAIQVFSRLALDYELAGDYQPAIRYAERQLELDPWREEVHRQLMRCLYFSGQRSAALAQYESCRKKLAAELSVEPELETRQLYQKIHEGNLTAAPPPPSFLRHLEPSQVERPRFVSRQGPLDRLHKCLERAMGGDGQLLLVTGSPGQGKTALVHEFIRQALQTHVSLAAASGNSHAYFGFGDPYSPFRELLEMLTGEIGDQWEAGSISQDHSLRLWRLAPYSVRALVQEGPSLIGTLMASDALLQRASQFVQMEPGLVKSLQSLITRQPGGPPPAQQDLVLQYRRVVTAISRQIALILFLDDLQWADQSSLALLFHLARELKSAHILLIGSFRPLDEIPLDPDKHPSLATMVNELRMLYGDILIDLDEQEERDFIDAYLGLEPNRFSESFRDDLFRYTHSHPLFTIEMLYGLQERGDVIKNPQGEWIVSPSLSWEKLPPKVEAVIAERLRHLPFQLLEMLKVASIGGERFTAEILAKILATSDQQVLHQLTSELDGLYKLVQADSIKEVNERRISQFRFRHILYQRFIYSQMNLIERARLHQRVGEILEEYYSGALDQVAVQLAVHFELANLPLKAIRYHQIAGLQATRMSSFEDAIAHLYKALSLLESQPKSLDKDQLELDLLKNINVPLMLGRGYAAPELGDACNRMAQLINRVPHKPEMLPISLELGSYFTLRAEYKKALDMVSLGSELSKGSADEFPVHFLDFAKGYTGMWFGNIIEALPLFEQMIEFYDPIKHGELHHIIGTDPGIDSLIWASWDLWLLGFPEKALVYSNRAIEIGLVLEDPGCLVMPQILGTYLRLLMKQNVDVAKLLKTCSKVLSEHHMPIFIANFEFLNGWYQVLCGSVEMGLRGMVKGDEAYRSNGNRNLFSMHLTLIADAYLQNREVQQAEGILHQVEDFIAETGEKFYLAETLRVKGEMRLLQNPVDAKEAEDLFCQAMQIAHEQEAKTLELRAASSLARLRRSQGRLAEARQVLAPVYDWFTEGFDTPDLKEAQALLNSLG